MDISSSPSSGSDKTGSFSRWCQWITGLPKRAKGGVVDFAMSCKKLGEEDPRRIVHALKVGLAITIVSLFYYFQPLYNGFGVSAMWAVLTVVVVFEYSVGATLGKGLNRMVATLLAGVLGVLAHLLADLSGNTGEPILLGLFGFLVAAIMTFMRFMPRLKAKCDYGLMIFILTFSLVAVSGYRDDEVIKIAQQRLSTIVIGSCIAMLICICICPVWYGSDLHKLSSSNLEKLGSFLEGFGGEYFKLTDQQGKNKENKSFLQDYKKVLGSKSTEETMANLAAWEPSHGRFRFRHPWKQYLKIGALARQCAYRIDSLNKYLNPDYKIPEEIQDNIKEACTKLSSESGKVLKELSLGMKKMRLQTPNANSHINKSKTAAQELKSLLTTTDLWERFNLLDVLPAATVASLLIDIQVCVESLAEAVHELGSLAKFKCIDSTVSPEEPNIEHVIEVKEEGDFVNDNVDKSGSKTKSAGQRLEVQIIHV